MDRSPPRACAGTDLRKIVYCLQSFGERSALPCAAAIRRSARRERPEQRLGKLGNQGEVRVDVFSLCVRAGMILFSPVPSISRNRTFSTSAFPPTRKLAESAFGHARSRPRQSEPSAASTFDWSTGSGSHLARVSVFFGLRWRWRDRPGRPLLSFRSAAILIEKCGGGVESSAIACWHLRCLRHPG